jgi:hypothetical protein
MRFYIILLAICIQFPIFSQKIMKLDTPRNPSKAVYYIGSPISFRLEDGKDNRVWYDEHIVDFDVERGIIIFQTWQVQYRDIIAIRNPYARKTLRTSGAMLKTFGLGLIFFSTAGRLSKDCPNCNEALVAGAGTTLVGWIIGKFAGPKQYKIGKKNRLFILDINFTPKKEVEKV